MLIYHSPLVKGKTRKRKRAAPARSAGKRKQPGINCFPILIKLGRRISVSYPGAFPPWPVKAVVHYSWTATMNPKQKSGRGGTSRFRLCLRTRSGKAFHLETADFQHAPRRRGPGRHDQRLSRQPRGNTGRRSPCRHEKSWPGKRNWNRKKADSVFFHFFFSACKQEGKKYLFPSFPGLSRLGTG